MAKTIIEFLLKAQNFDGGWGATEGKRSNTEATAFALLGLSTCEDAALTASIQRGLSWLTTRQHADGSWSLTDQHQVGSWATTLAIIALACFEVHHQSAIRGAEWLLSQKGRTSGWIVSLLYRIAPQKLPNRLNPDLQGWSWISDTFSWVEPTAYALIALKRLRPFLRGAYVAERIQQGTLLLYDRMCDGGGWNYGNSEVFGEVYRHIPKLLPWSL